MARRPKKETNWLTSLGLALIALGGGGLILPLLGSQFRILDWLGSAAPVAAAVLLVAGIAMVVLGVRKDKADRAAQASAPGVVDRMPGGLPLPSAPSAMPGQMPSPPVPPAMPGQMPSLPVPQSPPVPHSQTPPPPVPSWQSPPPPAMQPPQPPSPLPGGYPPRDPGPSWQQDVMPASAWLRDQMGRAFLLGVGTTRIGRAADNDMVLGDPTVSLHHAEVFADGGGFVIRDLRSNAGLFVNDGRVVDPVVLGDGNVVRVGGTVLVFTTRGQG